MAADRAEMDGREMAAKNVPPKFQVNVLKANCMKLFGVTSSTFCAAFHGKSGEYTIDEAKKHLDKWGKQDIAKKVKEDK